MSSFQPESIPGIESPHGLSTEEIGTMAEQIAQHAKTHPVVYEDRTSEAAKDQGWGPVQPGLPIDDEDHPHRKPEAIAAAKAANERRRQRRAHHESQYTDVRTDLAYDPPRVTASQEAAADVPTDLAMSVGHLAARRAVEVINTINAMKEAGNDPVLGMAIVRAHQEHHRN